MFVTKRKYEKLTRDYQRLFAEYLKISGTDAKTIKAVAKKTVAKKTTTKRGS